MSNLLKKHKYKLLTFMLSIVSIFTLFLGINKTYAYTITNDGNLQSDNLFNYENSTTSGSNLTYSNGVLSGYDSKNYFTFMIQTISVNDEYTNVYSANIYTTGVQYGSFNKSNDIKAIQFGHNGSSNDIKIIYDISNLSNGTYTLSINILSVYNPVSFNNIMLNVGSDYMAYEPYGLYYSSQNYNSMFENGISSIIKNGLNGTTAKLFALSDRYAPSDNLSYYLNNNGVYQEIITYSNSNNPYYTLSANNPNIYQIVNDEGNSYVDNYCAIFYSFSFPISIDSLIFERGDTTGTRYINIWFNDNSMTQLTIDEGSDNRHSILFSNSENKLITNILCTAQVGYNAVDSFSVPNSTAIYSSGFDTGYNSGYNDGLENGYSNGIKANNIESYNRGYNDGANTNLETNGMRTLFNSILSYPVNMIKSVFDFEFMGINISSLIMFVISIGIVAFVIKKFL